MGYCEKLAEQRTLKTSNSFIVPRSKEMGEERRIFLVGDLGL